MQPTRTKKLDCPWLFQSHFLTDFSPHLQNLHTPPRTVSTPLSLLCKFGMVISKFTDTTNTIWNWISRRVNNNIYTLIKITSETTLPPPCHLLHHLYMKHQKHYEPNKQQIRNYPIKSRAMASQSYHVHCFWMRKHITMARKHLTGKTFCKNLTESFE